MTEMVLKKVYASQSMTYMRSTQLRSPSINLEIVSQAHFDELGMLYAVIIIDYFPLVLRVTKAVFE